MRAHEFIQDDINPETVKPGFEQKRWYKGRYLMVARAREMDEYEDRPTKGLIIKVYDPKTTSMWFKSAGIAQARFIVVDRDHMEVSMVSVADEYQRQGIASAMYNFARELGNEVQPSQNRTDMGKAFWSAGAGLGRATPNEPPAPEPVAVADEPATTSNKPNFFKRFLKLEDKDQILKQRGIQIGSLIDLTKQFVAYNSLIGQVKGFTSSGKLQILIVHAEPKTNKVQYVVGDVISMAANYINKNSVINASK
jgi:GNAT superfamily N-acetyltransferase